MSVRGHCPLFLLEWIMENLANTIEKLLDQKIGDTDIFLVDLKILPGNKLQVFLDSDSGLTIESCAEISRHLEFHIENQKLLPENYAIEVSSPGIGQPLKYYRQYRKNIGRSIEVERLDETKIVGVLLYVDESKITIEEELKSKGRNSKKVEKQQVEVPFIEIKQTKVIIKF